MPAKWLQRVICVAGYLHAQLLAQAAPTIFVLWIRSLARGALLYPYTRPPRDSVWVAPYSNTYHYRVQMA